jgi:hypothetical protein
MAARYVAFPQELPELLNIAFAEKKTVSEKACWILDMVMRDHLELLLPHLDYFCQNLGKVKLDGSVRPVAKICEMLVLSTLRSQNPVFVRAVHDDHLESLATACFDWLISEQKVAPQAYAMTSLFYLGKKFGWIHDELRQVLEQNYALGSAAYQARARMVLHKLKQ